MARGRQTLSRPPTEHVGEVRRRLSERVKKNCVPNGWLQTCAADWLDWIPRSDRDELHARCVGMNCCVFSPPPEAEGNNCLFHCIFALLVHG